MYKRWCENVTVLEDSIKQIQRDLRLFISRQDITNTYSYTKLLSYLIICWSEARIMKLIYEPEYTYTNSTGTFTKNKSFTTAEIENIYSTPQLKDKWLKAVQIAITKHHNIPIDSNFPNSLPFTSRSRYLEIEDLVSNKLLKSIEIRNRIAHGQWKHAFTNDLKNLSQPHTTALRLENIVSLQQDYKIFKILAQLVHDISSSPATFNRDFDKNYKALEQNKLDLLNRDYNAYEAKLIQKYTRGKIRRNEI